MIKQRLKSDKAAAGSVETIIIIALAVFAALALFTFILKPTQTSAENMGNTIEDIMGKLTTGDSAGMMSEYGVTGGEATEVLP